MPSSSYFNNINNNKIIHLHSFQCNQKMQLENMEDIFHNMKKMKFFHLNRFII